MNKRLIILVLTLTLILLSICLLFSRQIILPQGVYVDETRNTDGSLTFTVRTISYNGSYHPSNVGAIWITNSSNQFIKTIKIWASEHRASLVKWMQSANNNTTGAITGATLNSHQLHSVTWNGKNYQNAVIPDGNYNVNVEFTESSSTTSNPGKFKSITFSKGSTAVDNSPASDAFFSNLHLVWSPAVANDDDHNVLASEVLKQNYPNPFRESTSISYYVRQKSNVTINIYNSKGQLVSRLVGRPQTAGWHEIRWDGKSDNGIQAVPGKYICRMNVDNNIQTRIMTLTK
jgi:flagellar hook assembly protein FlgD